MKQPTWKEYFEGRTKQRGDCILWTGYRNQLGYGRLCVSFAPTVHAAHRLSWLLAKGSLDAGMYVLHSCDVRHCVNPAHLWTGTQYDNIRDMCAKGRQRGVVRRGEASPVAKLTTTDVKRMRSQRKREGTPFYVLAKQFGVSTMTAHRAVNGTSWSHL